MNYGENIPISLGGCVAGKRWNHRHRKQPGVLFVVPWAISVVARVRTYQVS